MTYPTQPGITPPAPGQDKEEPELWQEDDIPTDDANSTTQDPVAHHPHMQERDD
jgi:hypothetical protein